MEGFYLADKKTDRPDLFPYQETGAKWLSQKIGALLADEMGLGKTAQSIRAADIAGLGRLLILCPAVARRNWEAEIPRFTLMPRVPYVVDDSKSLAAAMDALESETFAAVISSYDFAEKIRARLPALPLNPPSSLTDLPPSTTPPKPFGALIADEAHFLKSFKANRTMAALGATGLQSWCERIWLMTGTPYPNNYSEAWLYCYLFGATKMDFETFTKYFCHTYQPNRYGDLRVTGSRQERGQELAEMMKPFTLLRRKSEVMPDLPPIYYGDVLVEPGTADLAICPEISHYFVGDTRTELIEKVRKQEESLAQSLDLVAQGQRTARGMSKDAQVAMIQSYATSIPELRLYVGLLKVNAICEMVKSDLRANAYKKLVIFAHHRSVIRSLQERLSVIGIKSVKLNGEMGEKEKQEAIHMFRTTDVPVFIGNIRACGTAISLVVSHHVLFAELSYSPADNAQAIMRCHRIGQTASHVNVRIASLRGSIDSRVNYLIKKKTADLTVVTDALKHIEKGMDITLMKRSSKEVI